jgi:hypothetical protein
MAFLPVYRAILTTEVIELENVPIQFDLLGSDGELFTPDTMLVTLYDKDTETLLGGRTEAMDGFNANGFTISTGVVTWQPTITDHTFVGTSPTEEHILLIEGQWDDTGTTRLYKQELLFTVRNLRYVS